MKALSVKQPWAWAISAQHKTIENRTWNTNYRGSLAIHASRGWSPAGATDPRVLTAAGADFGATLEVIPRGSAHTPRSAFVAVAELVGCHRAAGCCAPWGDPEGWHWVLAGVHALVDPVPCSGALGLWTPRTDVIGHLTTGGAR